MRVMDLLYRHFLDGLTKAVGSRNGSERRIGAELKFPLVTQTGEAAPFAVVRVLWAYLEACGWGPVTDSLTGKVVGARQPGEQNDTVASCETGYCKVEFALAHVGNLFDLEAAIDSLRRELRPFAESHRVHFLGFGIQPVTPPSQRLLMKQGRTSVWDTFFPSNRCIAAQDGDDVHLFTINAATHVHVSVSEEDAIDAVNVLNGFAGAQIALTANSNIWRGRPDPDYMCVAEKFWDWWMPEKDRVGVPPRPFHDLRDYVDTIAFFRPVYVKRAGKPIVLTQYETFAAYYKSGRAVGLDPEGREVSVVPEKGDIDLHNTCYWWNARLSSHYTVENRVNDQQPPEDLLCVPALTLGLITSLPEAVETLASYDWEDLRAAREAACSSGLEGRVGGLQLSEMAEEMLALAEQGLRSRGLGEQQFLVPLWQRLGARRCPADEAALLFETGGIDALLRARTLTTNTHKGDLH